MKHWLVRVGDGINFRKSRYPIWGIKRGINGCFKTIVSKIIKDDILWFFTSKKYGGKIIGVANYECFYDKKNEPLISINTVTNKQQGWVGDNLWDIQINYSNLYNLENENIKICIQCPAVLLSYENNKDKDMCILDIDLEKYYIIFKNIKKLNHNRVEY